MGTNTETRQANLANDALVNALIPLTSAELRAIQRRMQAVLTEAKAPLDPAPFMDRLIAMAKALNGFATNKLLWWYAPRGNVCSALLQKHMAFTLFVPAGRADKARQAVDLLVAAKVLPVDRDEAAAPDLETRILDIIRPLVRFPAQKAKRLAAALSRWYTVIAPSILVDLENEVDTVTLHKHAMATIQEYGPKAAAHFMRNTGLMSGSTALPIIDVHILKLLAGLGFTVTDSRGRSLPYDGYVQQFATLSKITDLPPLLLDAMAWCSYAGNWDMSGSDFDNFGPRVAKSVQQTTVKTENDNDRNQQPDITDHEDAGQGGLHPAQA